MLDADFGGARGANAGDEFHELWALRQVLALLDFDTELKAVVVEGLRTSDEVGTTGATWEGVDCAFYFGGDRISSASRVVVDQLKYSSSNPQTPWTIARFCKSTNRAKNNSLIARLATAFQALHSLRPDLEPGHGLVVRLVSNQSVSTEVAAAVAGEKSFEANRLKLKQASGLDEPYFTEFMKALDLSQAGNDSRYDLDDGVVRALADLTEGGARSLSDELMRWIRRDFMMPDRPREPITRERLLIRFGVSDPMALFPCEPALKRVLNPVPRKAAQEILNSMQCGLQTFLLVGEGGCGKTTALNEVEAGLPTGSAMIIFDCYGGGRYLDSDAQRHRPQDAFLQLVNDLARHLRTPLMIARDDRQDWARTFKRRLEQASAVVAARAPEALLVVAVDAADNAVTAAEQNPISGRSFISDFITLGALPGNVRLLVTARPGRLELPSRFERKEIGSFHLDETALHVRRRWPEVSNAWIEDFHELSDGNPRVQAYALEQAGEDIARAIEFLRPNGKALDQIFRDSFNYALAKAGRPDHLQAFCGAIIGLPRPAPISHVAAVAGLTEAQVRNLISDLRPGLRLSGDGVGFADEDIEAFVRNAAGDALPEVEGRIADRLYSLRGEDPYAAAHVAAALLLAGRRGDIVDLIKAEREPAAISDPVLRQSVHLQRLRIAMKVCREAGDTADAAMSIIAGAEAVRTDAALKDLLTNNPDLAVQFGGDAAVNLILRDPEEVELHGPFIMHRMAIDAREKQWSDVREGFRRLHAWYRRQQVEVETEDIRTAHDWRGDLAANAAVAEALARTEGPMSVMQRLRRWQSGYLLHLTFNVCESMIARGEANCLAAWLTKATPIRQFQFVPLTFVALAGHPIDIDSLLLSLERVQRVGLLNYRDLDQSFSGDDSAADLVDIFLTGCEIALARGAPPERVMSLIAVHRPSSVRKRSHVPRGDQLALALRAHTVLEVFSGARDAAESFFLPDEENEGGDQRGAGHTKRNEEAQILIAAFAPTFQQRALMLMGGASVGMVATPSTREEYRLDPFARSSTLPRMRARAAVSVARLSHLPNIALSEIAGQVLRIGDAERTYLASGEILYLRSLSERPEWHDLLSDRVAKRAEEIRRLRSSAEEKSEALVQLARVLAPANVADAREIFNWGVEAAGEVDRDVTHGLVLFAPLVRRGLPHMDKDTRRELAGRLAVVAGDIGIRLDGSDVFPWSHMIEALVQLDVGVTLAAIARWEDENVIDRHATLPAAIQTGVASGALPPKIATALLALLQHVEEGVTAAIAKAARTVGPRENVAEELARQECLYFGRGERPAVLEALEELVQGGAYGEWLEELRALTAFNAATSSSTRTQGAPESPVRQREEKPDPLDTFDWSATRYISPEAVDQTLGTVLGIRKDVDGYFSAETVFDRMAATVSRGDRRAHLEALAACDAEDATGWEIARTIVRRVDEWKDAPAVRSWCNDRLLNLIAQQLPSFSHGLAYRYAPLPNALAATNAAPQRIVEAIISGIEQNVDSLDSATLYALVGLVAEDAGPPVAAAIAGAFADRLEASVPQEDREPRRLEQIPIGREESVARFLYAMMSDIEVPVRWRAAHATRCLARLGNTTVASALVELIDSRSEDVFRDAAAPFYWLSARLWLLITLDRMADEAPDALVPHAHALLSCAVDEELPHVLMREFAASAVRKLARTGSVELTDEELTAVANVNCPALPPTQSSEGWNRGFGHVKHDDAKHRRFHFDSMDTIPYWYGPASRMFVDVRPDVFLDTAETFIVDRWDAGDAEWAWEKQPRRGRMNRDGMSTMHRHGSLPSLERHHTHLEWHAMFCVVGALLRSHPLAESDEGDDWDTLSAWLCRKGLSAPPFWLADHVAPRPIEPELWREPSNPETWLIQTEEEEFRAAAGLRPNADIIIAADWDARSSRIGLGVDVVSGLVSPDTAGALLRAIHTASSRYDYIIPYEEGGEWTIDDHGFRLLGWLRHQENDLRLDELDPLRNGRRSVVYSPGRSVSEVLQVKPKTLNGRPTWARPDGSRAFGYEAWGDLSGDQDERRATYGGHLHSEGYRLLVAPPALADFMQAKEHDLLVVVTLTKRKNNDTEARSHDADSNVTRTRPYVLRRNGSLEAAEGCVGTWLPSGSRVGE